MVIFMRIKKVRITGTIANPTDIHFSRNIPVRKMPGRRTARSSTFTAFVNKPESVTLLGVAFLEIAGIISDNQSKYKRMEITMK
jgi:hypothetical protein